MAGDFERCTLNGVEILLPDYTLRTMVHCIHGKDEEGRHKILLEHYHSMVMRDWLAEGDATFLDVGAATGAMSIPFAKLFPDAVLVAFEPHRTVRQILVESLVANACYNVMVLDYAVSSDMMVNDFFEVSEDETGEVPYKPETSCMTQGLTDVQASYKVRTTTLDWLATSIRLTSNCVVKIDVEGWEVEVLKGAGRFISEHRPRFSIDIHMLPDGSGMAWDPVKRELDKYRYQYEEHDHVLLATPL